jgi:TPR repeat protein
MAADLARANELIRQSAMQGYAPAQQALGENIANGNGFQRDDATAAKLFRASADQGDPQAMNEYGEALSSGRGVAKDAAQAAVWFERAAQYGDAHAMHSLAGLLFAGVGTTRDVLKSYYWAQAALRFYGQNELDDMPHAAQLRSELLAAIERAVPLQVRQKLDVEVAAFRPKIWSVPSPPLVVPNRGQLESDPSVAAF